jgi:hypothetical protein
MDKPMNPEKVYKEILDFLSSGPTPEEIRKFQASAAAKARIRELIQREKSDTLMAFEKFELENFLKIEHLVRRLKAKI